MVRQGGLAFVILALAACTQDVDDPANFTAGNSQGSNSAGSSTSAGSETGGTTEVADGSASATSSTGGVADSTGVAETGPVADSGNGNCGNGAIDMGEQCDGANLQGFNCESLGLNGGTLACDPMMCTFDTSMCSSTTGGTSG